jgi:uncharacterized protein YhaN
MRLRRLDLTRYGKFTGKAVEFGPRVDGQPDLHVVYGLNEAGKSTAVNAYLDLLFGIAEKSRYSFLHPNSTMQVGGVLEFDGDAHDLRRIKARGSSLLDAAGQPLSDLLLGRPLGSLRRSDYVTMFSLDDETLERGGEEILASKGEIGKLLFQASGGVAALTDTLGQMAEAADRIHKPRAQKTDIAELRRKLAELKEQRDRIDVQANRYAALVEAEQAAWTSYEAAAGEVAEARRRQAELTQLLQAEQPARRRAEAEALLAARSDVPDVPGGAREALDRLEREDAALLARRAELDDAAARLDSDIVRYEIDERLIALGPKMVELSDAIGRQAKADEDLTRRRADLMDGEAALRAVLVRLGRAEEVDPPTLVLPAARAGMLRDLIEAHARLEAALSQAMAEQEQALTRRQKAASELDTGPSAPGATPALLDTLAAALDRARLSDAPRRLTVAEEQAGRAKEALSKALARLAPWSDNAATLDAMVVPDARRLEQLRSRVEHATAERADVVRRRGDAEAAVRRAEAQIAALTGETGTIDDAAATAALAAREAAWSQHLATLDRATAEAFAVQMRAFDQLAERRLAHAKDVAALRLAERQRAEAASELADLHHERDRLDAELSGLGDEIGADWPRGLPQPDTALLRRIDMLSQWLALRDRALVVLAECETAEADVARFGGEVTRLAAQLADALDAVGQTARPGAFDNLLALTDTVLRRQRDAVAAFEAGERSLEAAEGEVAARTAALARARADYAAWQERWTAALAGSWLAETPQIAEVRAGLDISAELATLLPGLDEARDRVAKMEADSRGFATLVAALHETLDELVPPAASLAAARALRERVDLAAREAAQLRRAEADRVEIGRRLVELAAQSEAHAARRAALFAELGVADGASALAVMRSAEERERLREQRDRAEADLRSAFDGLPLDACLEKLAGFEREAAQAELVALEVRLEHLDRASREQFAALTTARAALSAVDGGDDVARIEAERRTVLLELEERARAFLRLKAGALLATRALVAYRDAHRSSMLSRASEAFRQITRGAYTGLDTLPGTDTLIGLVEDGGSRVADAMSKGTRFQLYLALRLAGYQEFANLRPPVPFLADDIMETFDEPRSEEVFRLLAEMGRIGQTIYFTHHRHLCDMAKAVVPGVRVHEL